MADTSLVLASLGRQIAESVKVESRLTKVIDDLCDDLQDLVDGLASVFAEIKSCVCSGEGGRDLFSDLAGGASLGAAIGGSIGAAIGTIFPVIGTAIGFTVGAAVGAVIGALIGVIIFFWQDVRGILWGLLVLTFTVVSLLALLPFLFFAAIFAAAAAIIGGVLLIVAWLASGIGEGLMRVVGAIFGGVWALITTLWERFGWLGLLLLIPLLPLLPILLLIGAVLGAIWILGWILNFVGDLLWGAITGLGDIIWDAITWVGDRIGDLAGGIGDAVGSLWPFQTGGVVPGPRGVGVPILAHAGEGIFTADQMAAIGAGAFGGGAVAVTINGAGLDRRLLEWLRHAVRVEGGGSVQTALGQ